MLGKPSLQFGPLRFGDITGIGGFDAVPDGFREFNPLVHTERANLIHQLRIHAKKYSRAMRRISAHAGYARPAR